jgi:hypothetical protein
MTPQEPRRDVIQGSRAFSASATGRPADGRQSDSGRNLLILRRFSGLNIKRPRTVVASTARGLTRTINRRVKWLRLALTLHAHARRVPHFELQRPAGSTYVASEEVAGRPAALVMPVGM